MAFILDGDSIINLLAGGTLHKIVDLKGKTFVVGDYILEGSVLNIIQKVKIQTLIDKGDILLYKSDLSLKEFAFLKSKYNLSDSETETLGIRKKLNYHIVCDDLKARFCYKTELGEDKVIASVFLLKECVKCKILQCEEAQDSYQSIIENNKLIWRIDPKLICE